MVVAPLAGLLADAWGNRQTLALAAVVLGLVAVGRGASSFRHARTPT